MRSYNVLCNFTKWQVFALFKSFPQATKVIELFSMDYQKLCVYCILSRVSKSYYRESGAHQKVLRKTTEKLVILSESRVVAQAEKFYRLMNNQRENVANFLTLPEHKVIFQIVISSYCTTLVRALSSITTPYRIVRTPSTKIVLQCALSISTPIYTF